MSTYQDVLTPAKLTAIVKAVEKTDGVELVSSSFGSTTNKGENWNSSLVAVDLVANVDGVEKTFHWVGKFPPEDPKRQLFQKATMMADKEAAFYADLLPALEKFLKDRGLDQELKLAIPESPYAEINPECTYFLLKNLKRAGFSEEFDKQQGLDVAHTELALGTITICPFIIMSLGRFFLSVPSVTHDPSMWSENLLSFSSICCISSTYSI